MAQEIPEGFQLQAEAVFRLIERRVTHILEKLHLAAPMFLGDERDVPTTADLHDLEYTVAHWQELVPPSPEIRAILLHLLSQRYSEDDSLSPVIWAALNGDDPALQNAYKSYYGQFPAAPASENPDSIQVDERFFGLEWMYLKRGETLVEQGDSVSRVYLLLEGLLRADSVDADGNISSKRIGPSEMIGDESWLIDKAHAATVLALRDSDLVYMTRAKFESYVEGHPQVLRKLAANAIQRLGQTRATKSVDQHFRSIAILPATAGLDDFVRGLVAEIERFGTVKLLSSTNVAAATGHESDLESSVDAYDFVDWLEQQEASHDYLIYLGDADYPNWTQRCIEQADRILIAARAKESPDVNTVESILDNMPHPELMPPVELALVHANRSEHPSSTVEWLRRRNVSSHHHVALDTPSDFQRLVRHLRGRAVGIVFGGGGMRGLAHAGVIKALHDHGIQVDIAGGTSAGAIIAGLYGLGWDTDAIAAAAAKAMDRSTMFQPTLPLTAIVTGNRLNGTYQELFGDWHIEDMWTPIFTVASNLTQARMTVMDAGSLQKAVRASTSLAGILPPTIDTNYDLLLDGGAFNNTPADVMRERVGSGTVIAVDLGYTRREFPQYNYGDRVNGFEVLWSRINPFMKQIQVPSIMDIMMRSNGLGGMNATAAQVAHADLIVRPPVTQFGLYDTEAAGEIFQAGYTHGQKVVADWVESGGLRDTYDPLR
ncbi:MAG: patatin-like phospholipase family protein [Anaerolineae bacterium]|nr:patatin-like phospholipase family protein [Anaerolineae bacterium]